MPLTREDLIEESVEAYITSRLAGYNYHDGNGQPGNGNVIVKGDFPTPDERSAELVMTTVAIALAFDDGGRGIEIGSTLTQYTHTVECWVFATSPKFGRNLVNVIKAIVRHEGEIPLLDVAQAGKPQIDTLIVDRAASARQMNSSPRPWDQNVYTCTIRLIDEVVL